MHILSGTRGIQFPCNSVQDVYTYWDTKTGFPNNQILLCLLSVGLAVCQQQSVAQLTFLSVTPPVFPCFCTSVITQALTQSLNTIQHIQTVVVVFMLSLLTEVYIVL